MKLVVKVLHRSITLQSLVGTLIPQTCRRTIEYLHVGAQRYTRKEPPSIPHLTTREILFCAVDRRTNGVIATLDAKSRSVTLRVCTTTKLVVMMKWSSQNAIRRPAAPAPQTSVMRQMEVLVCLVSISFVRVRTLIYLPAERLTRLGKTLGDQRLPRCYGLGILNNHNSLIGPSTPRSELSIKQRLPCRSLCL